MSALRGVLMLVSDQHSRAADEGEKELSIHECVSTDAYTVVCTRIPPQGAQSVAKSALMAYFPLAVLKYFKTYFHSCIMQRKHPTH